VVEVVVVVAAAAAVTVAAAAAVIATAAAAALVGVFINLSSSFTSVCGSGGGVALSLYKIFLH